jgi:hypothetical protein
MRDFGREREARKMGRGERATREDLLVGTATFF